LKQKAVFVYTEVNTKSLYKTNTHLGVVYKDGKLSEKSILTSYCGTIKFYDALVEIGAKLGNNLREDSFNEFVRVNPEILPNKEDSRVILIYKLKLT